MSLSRRTIIARTLPAVAATTAVATAVPGAAFSLEAGHADAELLALAVEWREVEAAIARAYKTVCDIEDAIELPEEPEALFVQDGDHRLRLPRACRRHDGGWWYPEASVEQMRSCPHWCPESQARADEIVAAWDAWRVAVKAAKAASGWAAAEAEDERLQAIANELRKRIAVLPARTFAGLRAKAEIVGLFFPDDEIAAEIDEGLRGTFPVDTMALAIVRDLLAIGR